MLANHRIVLAEFQFLGDVTRVLLCDVEIPCVCCAYQSDLDGGWLGHVSNSQ